MCRVLLLPFTCESLFSVQQQQRRLPSPCACILIFYGSMICSWSVTYPYTKCIPNRASQPWPLLRLSIQDVGSQDYPGSRLWSPSSPHLPPAVCFMVKSLRVLSIFLPFNSWFQHHCPNSNYFHLCLDWKTTFKLSAKGDRLPHVLSSGCLCS